MIKIIFLNVYPEFMMIFYANIMQIKKGECEFYNVLNALNIMNGFHLVNNIVTSTYIKTICKLIYK